MARTQYFSEVLAKLVLEIASTATCFRSDRPSNYEQIILTALLDFNKRGMKYGIFLQSPIGNEAPPRHDDVTRLLVAGGYSWRLCY